MLTRILMFSILVFSFIFQACTPDEDASLPAVGKTCSQTGQKACNSDNSAVIACDESGTWTKVQDCNTNFGEYCINSNNDFSCGNPNETQDKTTPVDTNPTPDKDTVDTTPTPDKDTVDSNPTPDKDTIDSNPTPDQDVVDTNPTPDEDAVDNNSTPDQDVDTNTTPVCGNGKIEGTEVCDNNSVSCSTLDSKFTTGNAICKKDCSGFSKSACGPNPDYPNGLKITGKLTLFYPKNVAFYQEPDFTKSKADGGMGITACAQTGTPDSNGIYGHIDINANFKLVATEPPTFLNKNDPFVIASHIFSNGNIGTTSPFPTITDGISFNFQNTDKDGSKYINISDYSLVSNNLSNDYVMVMILDDPIPSGALKIGYHTGCKGQFVIIKFKDDGNLDCYYAVGIADGAIQNINSADLQVTK